MKRSPKEVEQVLAAAESVCGLEAGRLNQDTALERLENVARDWNCDTYKALAKLIQEQPGSLLRDQLIAAMTGASSHFFDEPEYYTILEKHLIPKLFAMAEQRKANPNGRKGAKVSVLCAGAGTGQEPYSFAMLIREGLKNYSGDLQIEDFSIIAADISPQLLSKAIGGVYSDEEIAIGLNDERRQEHFLHVGGFWYVGEEVKKIVDFRKADFLDSIAHLGGFDAVLCRRVLDAFKVDLVSEALEQFTESLSTPGYLALSPREALPGAEKWFTVAPESPAGLFVKA